MYIFFYGSNISKCVFFHEFGGDQARPSCYRTGRVRDLARQTYARAEEIERRRARENCLGFSDRRAYLLDACRVVESGQIAWVAAFNDGLDAAA